MKQRQSERDDPRAAAVHLGNILLGAGVARTAAATAAVLARPKIEARLENPDAGPFALIIVFDQGDVRLLDFSDPDQAAEFVLGLERVGGWTYAAINVDELLRQAAAKGGRGRTIH